MRDNDVTVVVPTIPARRSLLRRALTSVDAQTLGDPEIVVEVDHSGEGAAATRQRGLEAVRTPWVAFLDDDDEFLPGHLEALRACAEWSGADYVYAWYEVVGGTDPMPGNFGRPFDPAAPVQTTITVLVRTDLAQAVGFRGGPVADPNGSGLTVGGEDHRFTLGCAAAGADVRHLPVRTWLWHHHGGNTSGLPARRAAVDAAGRRVRRGPASGVPTAPDWG